MRGLNREGHRGGDIEAGDERRSAATPRLGRAKTVPPTWPMGRGGVHGGDGDGGGGEGTTGRRGDGEGGGQGGMAA